MALARCLLLTLLSSIAAFGQAPSAHPEFEVASVKKSAPATPGQVNIGVHIDGAMVRFSFLPMRSYIRVAYRVNDYQVRCAPGGLSRRGAESGTGLLILAELLSSTGSSSVVSERYT